MALAPHQLANLANMVVERNIGKKGKMTDISLSDQNFMMKTLLEMGNVNEKSGPQLKFNVMHSYAPTTKWSGLFDTDTPAVNNDTQVKGTVTWSKLTTSMTWDHDEPEFQGDDIDILDVLDEREHQAYNSRFTFTEPAIFSQPTGPSQENPPITGLPHWLPAATSQGAGFTGANPTGFTGGAAGIDATVGKYSGWKSYQIGWKGALGWENFVDPLLKGLDLTQFVAPHPYPAITAGKANATRFMITTYPIKEGLRRLLRKSNENVRYVDAFNNEGDVIKGTTVRWSAHLTRTQGSDQSGATVAGGYIDPLYAINFNYLFCTFQKGKKENWSKAIQRAGSAHTVWDKFLDSWLAVYTPDRRQLGFQMNVVA